MSVATVPDFNQHTVPDASAFGKIAQFLHEQWLVVGEMVADLGDQKYEPVFGDAGLKEASALHGVYSAEKDKFVGGLKALQATFAHLERATRDIGGNYRSLADADRAKADEIVKGLTATGALIPEGAGNAPVW